MNDPTADDGIFILMARAPARLHPALQPGPPLDCSSCVWAEVLCEIGQKVGLMADPDTWYLECYLDHEKTDKAHVCDLRNSEWEEYWAVFQGRASAHDKAAKLTVKLATYREVAP